MVRFWSLWCIASTAALVATCTYAQQTRKQFYPTVIYLVTSKFSVAVLGNMCLVILFLFGKITTAIFFGSLRDREYADMMEKAKIALLEVCFALAIFREEFNAHLIILFTAVLFCKIFHWLCMARFELFKQQAVPPGQQCRMLIMALMLMIADAGFIWYAMIDTMKTGNFVPSVLVFFGFEYVILTIEVVSCLCHYILHLIEIRNAEWTGKDTYRLCFEVIAYALKFLVYLVFFGIMLIYYGLPIHLVRSVWGSLMALRGKIKQFRDYVQISREIDERFPDSTPEDLQNNPTCAICLIDLERGKTLPCGHTFHRACLRTWFASDGFSLDGNQGCPLCRRPINGAPTDAEVNARNERRDRAAGAAAERADAGDPGVADGVAAGAAGAAHGAGAGEAAAHDAGAGDATSGIPDDAQTETSTSRPTTVAAAAAVAAESVPTQPTVSGDAAPADSAPAQVPVTHLPSIPGPPTPATHAPSIPSAQTPAAATTPTPIAAPAIPSATVAATASSTPNLGMQPGLVPQMSAAATPTGFLSTPSTPVLPSPAMSVPPTMGIPSPGIAPPSGMASPLMSAYSAPPGSMYNPMLAGNPMMQNPMMQNPMMQNPMMQNPMMQNPMMQNPMMGMTGYPNQMSMLTLQSQLQQLPQMLAYVNQLQQQLAAQSQEIPVSGNISQPQTQFPVPNPTTQTQTPTRSVPPQVPMGTANVQQQMGAANIQQQMAMAGMIPGAVPYTGGMMPSTLRTNPNLVSGSPAPPVPPVNQQPATAASVASAAVPLEAPAAPDTSTAVPQNVPVEMDPTSPANVLRRRRLQRFDSKTEE